MAWHYLKVLGHGKPGRNCLNKERPETMPLHTEYNTDNYDCFQPSIEESSPNVEDAGLGDLIASFHDNGCSQELRFEREQYSLPEQEWDATSESFIAHRICLESDAAQEITSAENFTGTSAMTARPFAPVLFEDHAASQDHNYLARANFLPYVDNARGNNASCGDPGPSVTSSGGAGLTKVTITGLASSALREFSEGSETGPWNTFLAPDFGYGPVTMISPAQYDAAPAQDIRHRRSSTVDSIAKRAKSFRDTPNEDYTITLAEIHITPLPATSAAEANNLAEGSARFQCSVCRMVHRDNHNLKEHERTHTGENVIRCTVEGCNTTTQRPRDMDRHTREIHSPIVPFRCRYCPKKYKRFESLNTHLKNKHL